MGKSTLFNAIAGRRLSIVQDEPGVTRDRNYTLVTRFGFPFSLVDTGGLVGEEDNALRDLVRTQTEAAIAEADLIIAVLDGLHGVHPLDSDVFRLLQRCETPVLWVVNKCESSNAQQNAVEFYSLGIQDPSFISAEHKVGIRELVDVMHSYLVDEELEEGAVENAEEESSEPQPIKIAILGKPNVGKSTLVNKLIGKERVVTSDLAGTTRDSIKIPLKRDGVDYLIFDTAGLRRKARVDDATVERFSNLRAIRSLAECDVAVLVIDAEQGAPTEQDAKIASLIHERGRGFIIAVNKWDAVEKDHRAVKSYTDAIRRELKFGSYAPIIFISAKSGRRCPSVLEKSKQIFLACNERIKTAEVNRIMKEAVDRRPPPSYRAQPIKLFFATQVETRPPEFVLFMNFPDKIGYAYLRYLRNTIRETLPFEGYDIKLHLKKRSEKSESLARAVNL